MDMDTSSIMKRSSNFSRQETELLKSLVDEYKNIIDRKETDKATIEEKSRAWEFITEEFNAQNLGEYRNLKVLRKKYNNLKRPKASIYKVEANETPIIYSESVIELDSETTKENWEDSLKIEENMNPSSSYAKFAEEKHKLEIKILKEEHQKKMKMIEEKHNLEMELLRYKIEVEKSRLYKENK